MSIRTILLIPRWSGTAQSDFYPYLERMLRDTYGAAAPRLVIPDLPSPDCPTITGWVGGIHFAVQKFGINLGETLCVGHSVGCQALLRYLVVQNNGVRPEAVLFVAAWWSVDAPWETIRPWLETPVNLEPLQRLKPEFRVLLSDNDPFTADVERNTRLWQEWIGAQVTRVPGRAHFNALEEEAVWNAVRRWIDESRNGVL